LTSDDIDELINTIRKHEFLLCPQSGEPEDLDIFKVGNAAKSKYTQAIEIKNANTSYIE